VADMPARSTPVAMDDATPEVREFLRRFREAGDQLDLDTIRASFAPEFLSLDPNKVTALARDDMLVALPRRRALFDSIGAAKAELADVDELRLDERHTLVRTSWTMAVPRGGRAGAAELVLRSTFLLRREAASWQIVVYLNHADVAALVAEHRPNADESLRDPTVAFGVPRRTREH
jgi:ketosteroid isomerase-like protein